MSDVEYILEANHRRARERELGERWGKIIRQRKRKSELLKASEAFCFSIGCVLLGGCPLRQLVLSGEGNGDSAVTVFGMIVGAALAHNFGLAGNPDSKNEAGQLVVGGISTAGKVAVIVGLVVLLVIALWNMPKKEATK